MDQEGDAEKSLQDRIMAVKIFIGIFLIVFIVCVALWIMYAIKKEEGKELAPRYFGGALLSLIFVLLALVPALADLNKSLKDLQNFPTWKSACPDYYVSRDGLCYNDNKLYISGSAMRAGIANSFDPNDAKNNPENLKKVCSSMPWEGVCCGTVACSRRRSPTNSLALSSCSM